MSIWKLLRRTLLFIILTTLLTMSATSVSSPREKVRKLTRQIEFDYVSWTVNSMGVKLGQSSVNPAQRLTPPKQHQVVVRYFELTKQLEDVQSRIQRIYTDPAVKAPAITARGELKQQKELQRVLQTLTPIAESILQAQVSAMVVEMGIAKLGDAIPPILFHSTSLPKALIVSPRDQIKQDENISLLADLTMEQITTLEAKVEQVSGSSALVVDVGGIGVYPTMVMRSSNLSWVVSVIAHEWTHNYLTLRPLGLNYEKTSELRTMNETTASISGDEISQEVLMKYYPETLAVKPGRLRLASPASAETPFDFRAEMHTTRVRVDELLSQGKITEAEQYMEERRTVFVNQGYMIRKLNQAYFAFYGAYAEQPGGAAGQDPVGPAVRELRAKSGSLAAFLSQIAKMNSFKELQDTVGIQ
jgi:hypothetical protein